jgi:hypothetical protein
MLKKKITSGTISKNNYYYDFVKARTKEGGGVEKSQCSSLAD